MLKLLGRLNREQSGSVFVESALLIIGVALAVAPVIMQLGDSLGDKVGEIRSQVDRVGS